MMKTNLIKTAGVILLATLMVSGLNAQASRQGGRGSGPYDQGNERKASYLALDLTEEQEEAMLGLRTQNYKTMKPLKNKMAELKARERTLISEESVNMKDVNKVIDEQTELMNQMRKIQVAHQLEVKEILSDEQIMKLDQRRKYSRNKGYRGQGHGQYHRSGMGRDQRSGRP